MATYPSGVLEHPFARPRAAAAARGSRAAGTPRADSVHGLEAALRDQARDPIATARLEEIHAARGEWAEVAHLCRERADASATPAEAASALCRAAEIARVHLGDLESARRLLRRAFSLRPEDRAVADQLDLVARASGYAPARRGRRRGPPANEVRALYTTAASDCEVAAPELANELWLRAAALDVAVRKDPAAALVALGRVAADALSLRAVELVDRIALDAADVEIVDVVTDLGRRAGDRALMLRGVLRSLELAFDLSDRARRHRAVAALVLETGEGDGADWHAREAQRLEPDGAPVPDDDEHDAVAAALADRYLRERRWHEAEPMLARLLRPGGWTTARRMPPPGAGPAVPRAELHYRAAKVAHALGKPDKACKLYRDALEYDPVHLHALIDYGRVAVELERWDEAHDLGVEALSIQQSMGRPAGEQAETLVRMARAREKTGTPHAALSLYEAALELAPAQRDAVAAAVRLHRAAGEHASSVRVLRRALLRADRAQRVDLLLELAAAAGRAGDDEEAATLCREALALAPGDRRALLPLVEHYRSAGMWREAVETVAALAALEDEMVRRGQYHQLAGALAAHMPGDEASDQYENALDCFFGGGRQPPPLLREACYRAFDDLSHVLSQRGEWKRLERAHRMMIKRLSAGAPELPRLWEELGRINRDVLGERRAAIQSFEAASALEDDRLTHHRILIDLYQGAGDDELDKLIARRRRLLQAEPLNPDHYAALRNLWVKTKDRDRVFCACRALVFLGAADRQENEFYRRNRPDGVIWPNRVMREPDWVLLRHPDEDADISALMGLIAEPIARTRAMSARRLGLRDDQSPAFDHVRHLFRNVCAALGATAPAPQHFISTRLEVDIVLANIVERGSLAAAYAIGCHMYQGRTSAQMVHAMSRAVSYARPGAYLRLLLGGAGLEGKALTAARAVAAGGARPASAPSVWADPIVERFQQGLARRAERPTWLSHLRTAVARITPTRTSDELAALERWGHGVDATARRAALLFSGALSVASSDLSREPLFARDVPREKRLTDLLLHSVSDAHFELRRTLRLATDD